MEVFAVDESTGREEAVEVGEEDTLGAVKRRMADAFGFTAEEDVELSVGGIPVCDEDSSQVLGLEAVSLESGCRVAVQPVGRCYAAALRTGVLTLRDIPAWARRRRLCVLSALQAHSQDRTHYGSVDICPTLRSDKAVMLAAVASNPAHYHACSPELRSDIDVTATAVDTAVLRDDSEFYTLLPLRLQENREVARAAARGSPSFATFNASLLDDAEVVLAALAYEVNLSCASERLRADPDFMLRAVCTNPRCLAYADKAIRGDRDIVLAALATPLPWAIVGERASLLQYASEELRADRSVVTVAVAINPESLRYASRTLQADSRIQSIARSGRLPQEAPGSAASATLCSALEEAQQAAEQSDPTPTVSEDITAAEAIRLVAEEPYFMRYLRSELRADPEVALAGIAAGGVGTADIDGALLEDKAFVLRAVAQNPRILRSLPASLVEDTDVFEAAFAAEPCVAFGVAPDAMRGRKELALRAVERGCPLGDVEPPARSDKAVVLAAASCRGDNFLWIPEALRGDRDVALAVVSNEGACYFGWFDESLRADKEIALAAVRGVPENFALVGEELRGDKEVALAAFENPCSAQKELLFYASEGLQSDCEVAIAAVRSDVDNIHHVASSLSTEQEIVTARQDALCSMLQRVCSGMNAFDPFDPFDPLGSDSDDEEDEEEED